MSLHAVCLASRHHWHDDDLPSYPNLTSAAEAFIRNSRLFPGGCLCVLRTLLP